MTNCRHTFLNFFISVVPEAKASDDGHNLVTGDIVEVIEGSMLAMQGKVVKIDGKRITIQPKHEEFKVQFCC